MTVLPLDRGEYSSEIGDCLKNSSFEATTIRHVASLDVLIFINLLCCDIRADYWFRDATHGRHAPTWLKPASPSHVDGIRKVTCEPVRHVRRGLPPPATDVREQAHAVLGALPGPREKHKDAAFLAYAPDCGRTARGLPMRLILGIILGAALTVGGAYVADSAAGAGGAKMVNWDVVAKNFDEVSAATRAGWKRITG